ncbi:MAG TPA: dihydrolipoamide acetyltransferase family protein [Gemmatimonadales bacterium]|nr:dihydrolipoamide acetyltransferase family protein [Gemmatimonadales bacterium]
MPLLGADMTAGRLVLWHKQPGDTVARGDILAEVDTDKGAIDIEVFTSGVLEKILVQAGEKVPVGTPLAIIREPGETAAVAGPPSPAMPAPAPPSTPVPGRHRASPAARKAAVALGVDLSAVQGTGPEGTIALADVERAAERGKAALPTAPTPSGPRERMRQAIAAAVARSKREIPHFYLSTTIDLARATNWLAELNAPRPVADRLLAGVLFIKAVALALRDVPELNARWDGDRAVPSQAIHVGVAIFLREGGLMAPALHDADRQPLEQLMRAFQDLVNRTRSGALRSSELSDPTITVTSLGERGVEAVYGVIYPPQVAIVGFGKIVERPCAVDGQVVSHPVVTVTLSADHRVTDGHRASAFLNKIDALLQTPERL